MIPMFFKISFQVKQLFIGFCKDAVKFKIDEFAVNSKSIVYRGDVYGTNDVVELFITVSITDFSFLNVFYIAGLSIVALLSGVILWSSSPPYPFKYNVGGSSLHEVVWTNNMTLSKLKFFLLQVKVHFGYSFGSAHFQNRN